LGKDEAQSLTRAFPRTKPPPYNSGLSSGCPRRQTLAVSCPQFPASEGFFLAQHGRFTTDYATLTFDRAAMWFVHPNGSVGFGNKTAAEVVPEPVAAAPLAVVAFVHAPAASLRCHGMEPRRSRRQIPSL
jgi:hypothetical protein